MQTCQQTHASLPSLWWSTTWNNNNPTPEYLHPLIVTTLLQRHDPSAYVQLVEVSSHTVLPNEIPPESPWSLLEIRTNYTGFNRLLSGTLQDQSGSTLAIIIPHSVVNHALTGFIPSASTPPSLSTQDGLYWIMAHHRGCLVDLLDDLPIIKQALHEWSEDPEVTITAGEEDLAILDITWSDHEDWSLIHISAKQSTLAILNDFIYFTSHSGNTIAVTSKYPSYQFSSLPNDGFPLIEDGRPTGMDEEMYIEYAYQRTYPLLD